MKGAYLLSMRGYKAVDVAAKLTIPILVLQGDRDDQVTAPDLAGCKAVLGKKPNVTIKQYTACNHLFIAGSGTPRPEEYMRRPGTWTRRSWRTSRRSLPSFRVEAVACGARNLTRRRGDAEARKGEERGG